MISQNAGVLISAALTVRTIIFGTSLIEAAAPDVARVLLAQHGLPVESSNLPETSPHVSLEAEMAQRFPRRLRSVI
jgi:hypothetical protein